MKPLLTYADLDLKVICKTENPDQVIGLACKLTQSDSLDSKPASNSLIKHLYKAGHRSVFEHVSITFLISNVSRSFLAQITRHRTGAFTSASQHYQNYSGYPNIVDSSLQDDSDMFYAVDHAQAIYNLMVEKGVPVYEARQCLPGSKAVHILWTVNARSLAHFLNLRLCKRNVNEMQNFARAVWDAAENWFPKLFIHVGPDCAFGECRQGRMKAEVCKIKAREAEEEMPF